MNLAFRRFEIRSAQAGSTPASKDNGGRGRGTASIPSVAAGVLILWELTLACGVPVTWAWVPLATWMLLQLQAWHRPTESMFARYILRLRRPSGCDQPRRNDLHTTSNSLPSGSCMAAA